MPSCRPDVISPILYKVMEMARANKPRLNTVLDVGAGCGKWGCLLTEYMRYWTGYAPEIDAVEPHTQYNTPAYGFYRNVFRTNVIDMLDDLKNYDLMFAIDVIEHMTREDGVRLLAAAGPRYIVCTPGYWSPQGTVFGNKLEKHISRWYESDFANATTVVNQAGRSHIIGWR